MGQGLRWRSCLAGLALAMAGPGASARDVQEPDEPAAQQGFAQFIAGRMPDTGYAFGAQATPPVAQHRHAISSLDALARHFNPLQDFTRATTINSELQVYRPAFNALDHRMAADHLALWANLHGGEWTVRLGSQPDSKRGWPLEGGPISWDRIPSALVPHAGEWRVGQLVALQNKGIYMVSELTPGVSLRLQPLQGSQDSGSFLYNVIAFLPIDSAATREPSDTRSTTLVFAPGSLAPTIKVGHRVAALTAGSVVRNAADVQVRAIDHASGTVTLDRALPVGAFPAGQRYVFYPRITAGQAWTRRQWDITHPEAFLAVEFDVTLFEGVDPSFESAGLSSGKALAAADAAHPDAPFGAWPALWAYSADDGDRAKRKGTSEMDFMEVWVSTNSGMRLFSTGNVGGDMVWARTGDGYSTTRTGKNKVPYSLAGARKIAVVYRGGRTYHYLDDRLVRIENFRWASEAPIQIGMNIAMGSVARGFAANLNFPLRPENFQRARMDVRSVRIWHDAGGRRAPK